MEIRDRVAQAIIGAGAIATVTVGIFRARSAAQPLDRPVGAISTGAAELLVLLVPLLALNLALIRIARRRGRLAVRCRHIHLAVTIIWAAWAVVSIRFANLALDWDTVNILRAVAIVHGGLAAAEVFSASFLIAFIVGNPINPDAEQTV